MNEKPCTKEPENLTLNSTCPTTNTDIKPTIFEDYYSKDSDQFNHCFNYQLTLSSQIMKYFLYSLTGLFSIAALIYFGTYFYWIYVYQPDAQTQAYISEKDPYKKLEILEVLMNEGDYERWAWLDSAAKLAFETKDYTKAERYSLESLSASSDYPDDWNYGNSIHNANVVLGLIRLNTNDIEQANVHLLAASRSRGSPQLNTFGPDLSLANELLIEGQEEEVLMYLDAVASFWEMDNGKVARWIENIEKNEAQTLCSRRC